MSQQQSCVQESLCPKNLSFQSIRNTFRILGLSTLMVCCLLAVAPTASAASPTDDAPSWGSQIRSTADSPNAPGQNDEEDPDELELEADPHQSNSVETPEAIKGWFLGLVDRLWGWLAGPDRDAPTSDRGR